MDAALGTVLHGAVVSMRSEEMRLFWSEFKSFPDQIDKDRVDEKERLATE